MQTDADLASASIRLTRKSICPQYYHTNGERAQNLRTLDKVGMSAETVYDATRSYAGKEVEHPGFLSPGSI